MKNSLIGFLLILSVSLSAQSPYTLKLGKELGLTGFGLATGLVGLQLRTGISLYTPDKLSLLDPNDVNAFDRKAIDNFSIQAQQASDIFFYTAIGTPLFFLPDDAIRNDLGIITIMWLETAVVTTGLTVLTKYTSKRTRPFVYNDQAPVDLKLTTNAKSSFFSGHASLTAASSFFAAKVFSDYHPDSKWKPVIWGTAAVIPALTGYFRVAGGKHFPTDVITGYAVGALIGVAIPQLHKKSRRLKKLDIQGGVNNISLSWSLSN